MVGALSNLALYAVYLVLTALGLGHKLAMTIMFAIGVMQTFYFNKRWSFEHGGESGAPLVRYAAVYAAGYAVNYLALAWFVDRLGYAHQLVQGIMIVLLAAAFFMAQRHWIFRDDDAHTV